jgi:CheY-like chemotaxis protein/signal transduction histidine kinase
MINASMRTEELLKQSQALANELQSQQSELKRSNEELEEQTKALTASQDLLKNQQEELQRANEELEEKASLLAEQKKMVETKNRELELAQASLEDKAEQLTITSKYKSEFLANMSHELRTPLNSVLLLAKVLSENKEMNLTSKQVEYLSTIYASGNDLLALINEVLDLSRIEAGKMEINIREFAIQDVPGFVQRSFLQAAEQKNIDFKVTVDPAVPKMIKTDQRRLEQILRNLLSNAFKFTQTGRIDLQIHPADPNQSFDHPALRNSDKVIAFSVTDTGIGVHKDHHRLIFEAFQQAEGSTNRKYGGTGLGLTISREIARLLGGEIHVESEINQGSTFTLYLPEVLEASSSFIPHGMDVLYQEPIKQSTTFTEFSDDRYEIGPDDRVILIIEDDANFARVLFEMAHERGFKAIIAFKGDTGLALALEFNPDAIILDLQLPVLNGWAVLDRLKRHPQTRHIPIHIISVEDERSRALVHGALAYLTKPVNKEDLDSIFSRIEDFFKRKIKQLLVVEDDLNQQQAILALIGNEDVQATTVCSGQEALEQLMKQRFDCMVLDLNLPDMSGFEILQSIRKNTEWNSLPVIVYTGRELSEKEETGLKQYTGTIVIKGASSPERLLDETTLFLHRMETKMPDQKRAVLQQLHEMDDTLVNKKILIVDDDVRNIFALTSVLENRVPKNANLKILFAEDGREGIEILKTNPGVHLVLMDIMMPDMDGYETIRSIRMIDEFAKLPIIALTAKAMKGDREKCIEAGASDYISKPVNVDQLLSLMRVWLYQ